MIGGRMKKKSKSFSYLLLLLVVLILVSCKEKEKITEVIRPVRTEQVFSTGGERIRTFSGLVQAGTESNLSFKVPGTVQKVNVEIGSKVSTGQLLIQLDPTDYDIQVKETENARDLARAAEIQAESNYERMRALYENRSASRSALDAARAAYESAHEQDNIAKKRRKLARNQLEYTSLKAPAAGAVSDVMVEENENVQSGQSVLILTSGSDLEVKIAIPEVLIAQIKEGDEVTIVLDAIKGKEFKAMITEVGVASTAYATTYPVMVRFAETDPDIRPGMAAEVMFTFKSERDQECYLVPPAAVSEDRLGRFVYIVEPAEKGFGIVQKKPVEIGELTPDGLEVLKGIEDGDYLVTAGVSRIQDSLKVRFDKPGDQK
jgi:RND family efflux transporter MFP subunit